MKGFSLYAFLFCSVLTSAPHFAEAGPYCQVILENTETEIRGVRSCVQNEHYVVVKNKAGNTHTLPRKEIRIENQHKIEILRSCQNYKTLLITYNEYVRECEYPQRGFQKP